MNTLTIRCISEALSPITHMQGVSGNEAMIAREPVTTAHGTQWIPFLSGNAIRHRAIREPGVLWLIQAYGLKGIISLAELNFLMHGGNLTESNRAEDTGRIAEMYRTWPLLRLLGGCLPNQILAGSLDVWRGVLVCAENTSVLCNDFGLRDVGLRPSEQWIDGYQYTRSDAKGRALHQTADAGLFPDKKSNTNLMIFNGQCVTRGAVFAHGFTCKAVSDLEIGALLWSLRLWQAGGGTIGGQASRGHGRLKMTLIMDEVLDQDGLCRSYVSHAMSLKDEAVAWLHGAFA